MRMHFTNLAGCILGGFVLTGCAPTIATRPPSAGSCIEIRANFDVPPDEWTSRIKDNAQLASQAMCSPEFLSRVRNWKDFGWTTDSPADVANRIAHAGVVDINVRFFVDSNTRAIASEGNGTVSFNKSKEAAGAGGAGNIAHEAMHAIGYRHFWNWPWLQGNTVPWRIGDWVDETVTREKKTNNYSDKTHPNGT